MTSRLRQHASKYHKAAHKAKVISKYAEACERFDKAGSQQHAAHVAAWIAYGPEGRIPAVDELRLLVKLLKKGGTGLIPFRLRQVLPETQAVLLTAKDPKCRSWQKASRALQKRLSKFRCCQPPAQEEANGAQEEKAAAISDSTVAPEACRAHVDKDELPVARCARRRVLDMHEPSISSKRLFRKMNEWEFLSPEAKVAQLSEARAIVREACATPAS